MNAFTFSPRIVSIASLLALAACELPTKVGNLSATDSDATTMDGLPDGTDSASSDGLTTGGTEEPGSPSTGKPDLTTGGTEEDPGKETETEGPTACDGLDEASCMAADCVAHYGVAYDFPGCSEGQVYMGCSDPQDCDDAETTFCKESSDEIYKRPDGCHPEGFLPCEPPPDVAFCGQCEALDEDECLAEPAECQPIYGAPHVEDQGLVCVDYDDQVFLRCIANGGACPPFIPTICPIGQPDQRFDSPSGCIPLGFESCEGEGTPQCM